MRRLKPISRDEVADTAAVSLETNQLHEVLDQRDFKGEHCLHLATFGRHYEIIRSRSEAGEAKAVGAGSRGAACLLPEHDLPGK